MSVWCELGTCAAVVIVATHVVIGVIEGIRHIGNLFKRVSLLEKRANNHRDLIDSHTKALSKRTRVK
jgi:hypothetical protein